MNKFSAHMKKRASSFKYYIFSTFICDKAGSGKNFLVVVLGLAMLLPLRRPVLHQLLSVQLTPVYPYTGKGPTGTFNTGGALDDPKPWTGLHQPPHQPEIAPRQ